MVLGVIIVWYNSGAVNWDKLIHRTGRLKITNFVQYDDSNGVHQTHITLIDYLSCDQVAYWRFPAIQYSCVIPRFAFRPHLSDPINVCHLFFSNHTLLHLNIC
jgi:hypothetical protein